MELSRIITYISLFIWLLPPLKQFRGRFFYYFLLQAISDPIVLVLFKFNLHSFPFYVAKDLLLVLLLWKPASLSKNILFILPSFLLAFYIADKINYIFDAFVVAGAHVFILYLIFKMATSEIIDKKQLKVFYILIMIYEVSVLLKYLFVIASIHTGVAFFYLTTAFEIMLGLSFIFIREDNTRLAIQISE